MAKDGLNLKRAQRTRLSDSVCEQLIQGIGTGSFEPGSELPSESTLAQEFGVSKPVVREALGKLASFGALQIRQGRPATVTGLTASPLREFFSLAVQIQPESLREAIELRRAIETQTVALAAVRATDGEIAELRALVDQMADQTERLEAFIEIDIKFHRAVAKASHNQLMRLLVDALEEIMRKSIINLQMRRKSANKTRKFDIHRRLLKAIEDRDPEAAAATMNEHFDASAAVIDRWLSEEAASS